MLKLDEDSDYGETILIIVAAISQQGILLHIVIFYSLNVFDK